MPPNLSPAPNPKGTHPTPDLTSPLGSTTGISNVKCPNGTRNFQLSFHLPLPPNYFSCRPLHLFPREVQIRPDRCWSQVLGTSRTTSSPLVDPTSHPFKARLLSSAPLRRHHPGLRNQAFSPGVCLLTCLSASTLPLLCSLLHLPVREVL